MQHKTLIIHRRYWKVFKLSNGFYHQTLPNLDTHTVSTQTQILLLQST